MRKSEEKLSLIGALLRISEKNGTHPFREGLGIGPISEKQKRFSNLRSITRKGAMNLPGSKKKRSRTKRDHGGALGKKKVTYT